MKRKKAIYPAFTLIEMLVVLIIFTVLFGIGISAFSGLRTTILMNQTSENIKQNFRWTQRAAILLKRDPGDNWIYGIGIDLSQFYGDGGVYRVFKWCAPYREYSDDTRASGQFPNYTDGVGNVLLGESANIPFHEGYKPIGSAIAQYGPHYSNDCSGILPEDGVLIDISGTGSGLVDNFTIPAPLSSGYLTPLTPRFILFESVSGNVFFYNRDGVLINFHEVSEDTYELIDDPIDLDFVIKTPNGDRGINLILSSRSGKLTDMKVIADPDNNYTFGTLFVEAPTDSGGEEPVDLGGDELPIDIIPETGDDTDIIDIIDINRDLYETIDPYPGDTETY